MYTGMVSKYKAIKYSNCQKYPSATQLMTKCNTGSLHWVSQNYYLSVSLYISKKITNYKKGPYSSCSSVPSACWSYQLYIT